MPEFTYRGRDRNGDLREGERFANNMNELNSELIMEGVTPIDIRLKVAETALSVEALWQKFFSKKINKTELSILMRQMQLLCEAHVPLLSGLTLLSNQIKNKTLQEAFYGISAGLEKGQSLATSMRGYPIAFPPIVTNIVEVGEKTGNICEAFGQIHDYLEFEISSMKKLKETLRYPTLLFASLVITILSINIFVIPTFAKVYLQLDAALPWQTRLLINMSNAIVNYGIFILIILIIVGYLLIRYFQTEKGRYRLHHFLFTLPIFGRVLKRLILIRFAKTLSIVLHSGMPLLEGLHFTADILGNEFVKQQMIEACNLIERGNNFVIAISTIEVFSPLEIQMMVVGEQHGELGPSLNYIHTFHTSEIEFELKRIQELLGPILVASFSVIILVVALGVYLPIWNLTQSIH